MKKVYSQPTMVISDILVSNICIGSVKSNMNIKYGGSVSDYSGAV